MMEKLIYIWAGPIWGVLLSLFLTPVALPTPPVKRQVNNLLFPSRQPQTGNSHSGTPVASLLPIISLPISIDQQQCNNSVGFGTFDDQQFLNAIFDAQFFVRCFGYIVCIFSVKNKRALNKQSKVIRPGGSVSR